MSGAQVRDVCSFSDSQVVSVKVLLRARGMRILFRDVMERHLQAISVVHVCADFLKGGTAARKKKHSCCHCTGRELSSERAKD